MARNINRVTITGNLTADPDLRATQGGTSVCSLRVAVNGSRKDGDSWVDKPNYFTVVVWGKQGENCAHYLAKGRPIAVDGRLDWRSWEVDGQKRQTVEIVADTVQFLGPGKSDGDTGGGSAFEGRDYAPETAKSAPPATADDDIPF